MLGDFKLAGRAAGVSSDYLQVCTLLRGRCICLFNHMSPPSPELVQPIAYTVMNIVELINVSCKANPIMTNGVKKLMLFLTPVVTTNDPTVIEPDRESN